MAKQMIDEYPQDRGARMRYTLDVNILINMANRYPRDLFASLWESTEGAVASGEICVCEVILKELERGDDNLAPWVKSVPGFKRTRLHLQDDGR